MSGLPPATSAALEAICRLWGPVCLLHPWVASRDVDWDAACRDAIAAVLRAGPDVSIARVVAEALAAIGDPLTRLVPTESGEPSPDGPSSSTDPDGSVVVLTVRDFDDRSGDELAAALRERIIEARERGGLVLDLRRAEGGAVDALWDVLPDVTSGDAVLLEKRSRIHSGWDSGTGSGGYFSGFVTSTQIRFAPQGDGSVSIVAVVDERTGMSAALLVTALIALGSHVVTVGSFAEPGNVVHVDIDDATTVSVRTSEWIVDGRSAPLDAVPVPDDAAIRTAIDLLGESKAARGTRSPPAPTEAREPTQADRILGLFRLWTVIRNFFAYVDLTDEPWDDVLSEFLPRVAAASDDSKYVHVIAEACARMDDSHAMAGGRLVGEAIGGVCVPPVALGVVEDTVIVGAVPDGSPLRFGEVVVAVDDHPIAEAIDALRKRVGGSSSEAQVHQIVKRWLLMGAEGSEVQLTLRDERDTERSVVLERQQERFATRCAFQAPGLAEFEVLPSGVGYIDLTRLQRDQIDEALEAVRTTPALVMDMRGYPNGVFPVLAPRFAKAKARAAMFRRPEFREPRVHPDDCRSEIWFSQWVAPSGDRYAGRVCVLIDMNAGSQAEHTCLWLEAACDPVFVGSPTMGVNGDVTRVEVIPGLLCVFSGHDVRHGDGRQLQRIGIRPHVEVRPTLAGVRECRDEVLEAAITHLTHA